MSTPDTSVIDYRVFGEKLELREVNKPGFLKQGIQGYAIVYDSESRDMGGFREIIARGAMKESMAAGNDVFLLYQHDAKQPMARESAGTLTLREDTKGVFFTADLTDTALNRDALLNVQARNLSEMSFGMPYSSVVARWERSKDKKYDIRTITKASFVEISIVSKAAYPATSLTARDYETFRNQSSGRSASDDALRSRWDWMKHKRR